MPLCKYSCLFNLSVSLERAQHRRPINFNCRSSKFMPTSSVRMSDILTGRVSKIKIILEFYSFIHLLHNTRGALMQMHFSFLLQVSSVSDDVNKTLRYASYRGVKIAKKKLQCFKSSATFHSQTRLSSFIIFTRGEEISPKII